MRHDRRRSTRFRLVLGGLAALIAGPAVAQVCAQPAERLGFEVRLVQSTLQVAALQCRDVAGFRNLEDQYRAFVQRFQGEFATSSRGLQSYFRRTSGAQYTRALDSYITQLAQAQAAEGSGHGNLYCPNIAPLFSAALAQPNLAALAELSTERNLLNIMAVTPCPPPAPRAPARPARARS